MQPFSTFKNEWSKLNIKAIFDSSALRNSKSAIRVQNSFSFSKLQLANGAWLFDKPPLLANFGCENEQEFWVGDRRFGNPVGYFGNKVLKLKGWTIYL